MSDQAGEMAGQGIPCHGEFVWTEIASTDAERCMNFYKEVLGWTFSESSAVEGMDYREFRNGTEEPIGGLYQLDPKWFDGSVPPAHFMTYIMVDDLDGSAKLAETLGGKIQMTMEIPNVGRMSTIEDPTGAVLTLFNPSM